MPNIYIYIYKCKSTKKLLEVKIKNSKLKRKVISKWGLNCIPPYNSIHQPE